MLEFVDRRLETAADPELLSYLQDRRRRYKDVFEHVQAYGIRDTLRQAIVIWNRKLFFEFHEQVEELWRKTKGRNQRRALQAMIMAAGVYEHLAYRNTPSAERLSRRAAALLVRHKSEIRFFKNIDDLVIALQRLDPDPPRLLPTGDNMG
jgi:hypothetical protein